VHASRIRAGVTLYALPSINALMQKYSTIATYREVFVQQFQDHQRELAHASGKADPTQRPDPKDTCSGVKGSSSDPEDANGTEHNRGEQETTDAGRKKKEEDEADLGDDFTAQEIFNKVLTDSVLYYLFVNSTTGKEQGADGAATEKDDSKLSVIFQAFLQTAAFSYQNDPNEGAEGESEEEKADTSGKSERNSFVHEELD